MTEIYRRRLIPDECIHLHGDNIVFKNENMLITTWNTLHPKEDFASGISLYLPEQGWKISKFLNSEGKLVQWYCDIVTYDYDKIDDTYVFTDLLADVIIDNTGFVKVVDLDELSDAYEKRLISAHLLAESIRKLNNLLTIIYSGAFDEYKNIINQYDINLDDTP